MTNSYKGFFILLFALCFCYADDWCMFRADASRRGYSAEDVGIPVAGPMWVCTLKCNTVSSPSVVGDILYIGGRDSALHAIDVKGGKVLWRRKTGGWVDCSPLVYKNMVIVGSRDGRIYVFDRITGDSISMIPAGLQLSSPCMVDDSTALSGLGPPYRGVGAYELNGGKEKWLVEFSEGSYSSPALVGKNAVIGDNSGKLYNIDLAKRGTAWMIKTGGGIYLSTPVIDEARVYFAPGNYDMDIYCVDLSDGKVLWKGIGAPMERRVATAKVLRQRINVWDFIEFKRFSPEYRSRVIERLFGRESPMAKVLSPAKANDSAVNDVWSFYAYGDIKTSSVAVCPRNVYVIKKELGSPKPRFTFIALDKKTGRESFSYCELRNSEMLGYCSSPVVTGDYAYFGWGEGMVYAFETRTGKKVWNDKLESAIISSPAISQGKLYLVAYTGAVYAYDLMATADPLSFQDGTYCYPNPAKGVSYIQYYTEKAGAVEARIYDGGERLVKVFRSGGVGARTKGKFSWELSSVSNGVFFGIITASYSDGTRDRKIIKIAVLK